MLLPSVVQMYAAAMMPNDSGSALCCTDPLTGGIRGASMQGSSLPKWSEHMWTPFHADAIPDISGARALNFLVAQNQICKQQLPLAPKELAFVTDTLRNKA